MIGAFDATQWMAMAQENERVRGWYVGNNKLSPHAVPPSGMNSGVVLVNLTRSRESKFTDFAIGFNLTKLPSLNLGDQDVLNWYFRRKREQLFVLPCHWNRRKGSNCDAPAGLGGIYHGNHGMLWPPREDKVWRTAKEDIWETLTRWIGHAKP